jgi:disease resistance protein RPM1
MAEAILLAVSKIGTVALNEAVSAVMEKLSRKVDNLKELPLKVKRIEKELMTMNAAIQDVGTTHLSNNVIKTWIAHVRKLAYHVEDVIDKYSYEALKLKEEGFLNRYVVRVSPHVKVFSKIADEVVEIEEEIRHVKELQREWSATIHLSQNEHAELDRRWSGSCFSELVSDEELVGIEENRSKLTEWLATDEEESTVITVSGMGGLGKTTLVKNVYDREKAKFPDAHAWIVVSQAYDVVDLLGRLLSEIRRHTEKLSSTLSPVVAGGKENVYELTEAIKKTLQDRRCLVVLDDVWDKKAYTQMCSAFQGVQGSRVIITTRKEDVASLAPLRRRLLLQPLGRAESFKLFCSRAFHNIPYRNCPPELQTVAVAVVERCHGLPLAIVSSGSLMSTKLLTGDAWNQMYNRLQSELRDNDHVQAILNLSYHDLPGDLRNCFLYCSLFPEDYAMPRESLVRMWLAEGFATQKDNSSTPEEVAEWNLMELIGRNMLEVVERDELNRVSTCKMHDIVRDLALAVAKEERFGSANDQGEMMRMDREVRRFSTSGWTDGNTAAAGVEFPRLRTVISLSAASSSANMISSVLSGSSYLTVLELQDSAINQVPASIGNLFNLRYIGLRRTNVQSLPDTVEKLSNLQTLDIKQTRIEHLPPGIVKVDKLRHLLADRFADEKQTEFRYFIGVEAPEMISNLQELQTLETAHASKDLSLQLKKMSKLQTVWIDNINASNCKDLFDALSNMPLLSSLLLSASDEKEIFSFQALKPVSKMLHRLIIRGGWADGTLKCPIFQGHGKYLRYLALSWCDLGKEDPLQQLAAHVPDLTYLSLNRVSSAGILVLSADCFPQLKTLVLKNMPNVQQLVIEKRAIPCIDGIYIVSLQGMSIVPQGIESLRSLKKLWMLHLHRDFMAQWIQNQMHYRMKHVPELRI